MGYFATEIPEPATPLSTDPGRARQHPACGQKPLKAPLLNAISGCLCYYLKLGRWINRGPIIEESGVNLYRYVGDRGVN